MSNEKRKGFTLAEMLVVIAVIAILGSMLFPTLSVARRMATSAATLAEIKDIEAACRDFQEDFGFFPPDSYGETRNLRSPSGFNTWAPLLRGCPPRDNRLFCPDDQRGPENSTRCLVFFLGSEFTIGGRKYGPYFSFVKDQLYPHPDDPNWQGIRYPAKGVARSDNYWRDYRYGYQGTLAYQSSPIPWSIRGVNDDTDADVRLFTYMDKFGPPRRDDLRYNNWYVYDCHQPECWEIYGPDPQPPDHNRDFVDIYSHGYDGTTSVFVGLDNPTGGGGGGDDIGDEDGEESGKMRTLRGMWGDDINNWTDHNQRRQIFKW